MTEFAPQQEASAEEMADALIAAITAPPAQPWRRWSAPFRASRTRTARYVRYIVTLRAPPSTCGSLGADT